MNKALKDISTSELVKELETREGVQKINIGLYQPYEIKGKFGGVDIKPLNITPVLIINQITKEI